MKKNKKKLPRYWLGTRKPTGIGYQPNLGIGDATFSTTPGQSLTGEATAARQNILPTALGKLGQNTQYPMQMLQNINTIAPYASLMGTAAINKAGGIGSLLAKGATPIVKGVDAVSGLPTEIGVQAGDKAINTGLNTLGKAAGVLGTAYGAYNIYNDFANSGPGLSQSDIANSASVNTYTTAHGNTYTQHGGVDRNSILNYAGSEATKNRLGLTMDAMGTGASIGGFFGPVGMGIGAGVGLLAGGVASLLGFGDNEDEYKEMMRRQEDVFAMQDRQSESVAKDKDTKTEFYNRAANGKRPVWTPAGLVGKNATARVSNGEVVGNFEDGVATRIPGQKNNKDTKLAALKDGDFVITNKYGLSDYAAATGDYAGALDLQEMIMGMRNSKGYKNGKLPKCADGMWDNVFSVIPHLTSFANNLSQYNRAKNADTYVPDIYFDNAEGARAVNELAQLRFDANPYYNESARGLNYANYDARRNVGLGIGGRAIAQNANYQSYLNNLANITKMTNEANAGYRSTYANALANLGATNQGRRMEAAARRYGWQQQAQGQKESWIAQYLKNIDQNLLNAAADYMRMGQYNDSLGIQNKMLDLYERQVANEEYKTKNGMPDVKVQSTTIPAITTPPQMIARPTDNDIYSKILALAPWRQAPQTKSRSRDPYTNIYNLAPWH